MGFSQQEYWSGLPGPPPGDLPNTGIEPGSPALQADCLSLAPPDLTLSSADFQSQTLWELIFLVQVPQDREPDMKLEPLAP